MVRDRYGRPQEDPLAVHCFCVCSGSAQLGDLLGVSRSIERDLSVLSICRMIFLRIFTVYRFLLGYLVVKMYYISRYQYLLSDWLDDNAFLWQGDYLYKAQVEEMFLLSFVLFILLCIFPGSTQCTFHTPMARYSSFVLKVPLNTNESIRTFTHPISVKSSSKFVDDFLTCPVYIHTNTEKRTHEGKNINILDGCDKS